MADAVDFSEWRVMVVDDNDANLVMIREVLESRKVEVLALTRGYDALDAVDDFAPTLILLDIAMPELDGYTLLEELRKHPNLDQVPIVAVTARTMYESATRTLEAGFNGFVSKPFRVNTFFDEMLKSFDRMQDQTD